MERASTFAERMQELLDKKSITKAELSRRTGISKSSITHYVKGDWEAKQDALYAIATEFHINEAWLMGYDVPMEKAEDNYHRTNRNNLPANILPLPAMRKIPLIGTIACGTPILATENLGEDVFLPDHIRNADFALRCKGDSMINAGIQDGDIVYIRQQDMVDNGQIAAVVIEDEATLKRVYYNRPANTITLVSENPVVPPLIYSGETLDHIRIIGKAVGYTHSLEG